MKRIPVHLHWILVGAVGVAFMFALSSEYRALHMGAHRWAALLGGVGVAFAVLAGFEGGDRRHRIPWRPRRPRKSEPGQRGGD